MTRVDRRSGAATDGGAVRACGRTGTGISAAGAGRASRTAMLGDGGDPTAEAGRTAEGRAAGCGSTAGAVGAAGVVAETTLGTTAGGRCASMRGDEVVGASGAAGAAGWSEDGCADGEPGADGVSGWATGSTAAGSLTGSDAVGAAGGGVTGGATTTGFGAGRKPRGSR